MARVAGTSIDALLEDAVRQVIGRVSKSIAAEIARMAASEMEKQLVVAERSTPRQAARRRAPRSRPRVEITKWVADKRARRVPTFVIEMTGGLDTKKKIVAKYGEDATFELGKPAPKPLRAA